MTSLSRRRALPALQSKRLILQGFWSVSLGYRVLGYVLLVCALLAVVTTGAEIATLYAKEKRTFEADTAAADQQIRAALRNAYSNGAGDVEIREILQAALMRPGIAYIALSMPGHTDRVYGDTTKTNLAFLRSELINTMPGTILTIGSASTSIHHFAALHAAPILLRELSKGLLLGLTVLFVFERLTSRRLRRLTHQVLNTSWRCGNDLTSLERNKSVLPGEVDRIILAFEAMRQDARDAFARLEREKRRSDRLNTALRTAQSEQASLTNALSHDLITPVNTMRALVSEFYATRPICETDADDVRGLLHDMEVTAARMTRQIQNVMLYSELLASVPRMETVALEDVLRSTKRCLADRLQFETRQITWNSLGDVQGDPHDLAILFEALLTNGLVYAHPDRPAQIRVQRIDHNDPRAIKIIISDNGQGIPKQHITAVLELFSRLHTYADIPGTGLGLSLCRRIMERHNGAITLASDDMQGTQVTLCFPKGETE